MECPSSLVQGPSAWVSRYEVPTEYGKWKLEFIEEGEECAQLPAPAPASPPPTRPRSVSSATKKPDEGKMLGLYKALVTGLPGCRIQIEVPSPSRTNVFEAETPELHSAWLKALQQVTPELPR